MALSKIDVANMLTGVTPVANGGTAATTLAGAGLKRPNAQSLIINGNMAVAQRGTSTTGVTSADYPACDRWNFAISSGGTWTVSQDTDVPSGEGFLTSMKYDCTTAESSLGSAAYLQHRQSIEGQNLQLLKKGTSNAEKLTVSFWVKATKTGTNILELFDNTNNRQVSKAYTISSSNTWENKVVNFPADTSGALANSSAGSLNVQFYLGVGSNLSSGTLSETWTAYTNANRAVGQVNHADSTSNNFYITGIQLEIGEFTSSTLPPFQHENFGDNLDRCKRYYQMIADSSDYFANGYYWTNSEATSKMQLEKEMRTQPTLDGVSGSNYFTFYANNTADTINDFVVDASSSSRVVSFTDSGEASGTAGMAGGWYRANASARFGLDAEL